MPSDSGVTSSSSTSLTSPLSTPPWIAAPTATTSSGFTPLCGSLPKYSFTSCWIFGDARRAADEHDLVDVRRLQRRHRRAPACTGAIERCEQVVDELLELRARQLHLQVLRTALIRRDERQVDVGLEHRRELDLGLLRRFLQTLKRHAVLAQIDAVALLELGDHPVDDALIEVVAAEVRVAVGRLHLDDALAHFEDRDVERAAAEVVDGDRFVLLLVEAVGQRRRGRLVDDAQDVEAGDLAGVLRRLPLRVVEVRRAR